MSNNPKYDYVPIVSIFAKLERDLGLEEVDEKDVIEWTGEALEFMGSVPMYEEAVAFIEVKNHQVEIPNGCLQIDQIGRNNRWSKAQVDGVCPAEVLTDINNCVAEEPVCNTLPIPLDCNGSPLMDYNIAYFRPYYDLIGEYYGWNWKSSRLYQDRFTPVRLATDTFFGTEAGTWSNDCSDGTGCVADQYKIIRVRGKAKVLRFNFKEGQVAVAYLRQCIDEETGYPLVPDSAQHKTAITKYITMKMVERDFYKGREGAKSKLDKFEADWHWYCSEASTKDLMPHGIDEHQNLLDQRQRLLPNNRQYFSFFGKMNVPEGKKWNDPDHRNYTTGFFRGTSGFPS
jgi:hypothetical protein